MRFGNPQMLWVLLVVPVLALLVTWSQVRRRQALARFASPASLERMGISLPGWRAWVRPGLALMAVIGIVLATARPQWGWEDRRIISRGVDLMIAIDTSNSMLADDYKPSRLDRARELLQNMVWEAKGDRIGVMAFAGNSVVLCPLTLDYSMANTALESLDTKTVQTQGTAIGTAIDGAVKAFESGGAGERVLVLLTDGEDQGTEPLEAAKRAAGSKIKVFCIGIGSTQGALIPVSGGYKQDKEGHPVNTKLDFQTLTEVARITNGRALKANFTGAAEVTSILSELSKLKGANQQDRIYRVYKERYPWFLVPAILLLLLESFGVGAPRRREPVTTRRRDVRKPEPAQAAAAIVLLAFVVPSSAVAYPGEAKVLSDKAIKEYKSGNYAQAAQHFAEAATKAGDNALAKFNLGAASYKAGESAKATESFKSVFDPQNPALNAAAEYNTGVLEHKDTRKEVDTKKQAWQKSAGQGDQKTMEDIKKSIAKLETASNRYKSAITKAPSDNDMKVNYEIARRDLDELKKILEQQQPPPQQQQQKQDQQKQDQKQDQKQQPPPQQSNQKPEDQQGQKGQQQDQKKDPQKDQKQDPQKNDEQKQDQQNKDQQKDKPNKPEQGEPKQDENKEQQEQQEQQNSEQKKPETAKATPTPKPGNEKQGQAQGASPGDQADKEKGEQEEQVAIGEMSKADVDRLLNSLPPENNKALQRFLNANYKTRENMEKDW